MSHLFLDCNNLLFEEEKFTIFFYLFLFRFLYNNQLTGNTPSLYTHKISDASVPREGMFLVRTIYCLINFVKSAAREGIETSIIQISLIFILFVGGAGENGATYNTTPQV